MDTHLYKHFSLYKDTYSQRISEIVVQDYYRFIFFFRLH